MKIRILRITILAILIAMAVGINGGFNLSREISTVRAVGDLRIDWGVPEGQPLFVVKNMSPGQKELRVVKVINNADSIRPVGVRGVKVAETGNLSEVLEMIISRKGKILYDKRLVHFLEDSKGPEGIMLGRLNPKEEANYDFQVVFSPKAGNAFQSNSVVFDLKMGIAVKIPDECQGINFTSDPLFGTEGNDNLRGTNGNDLIYGFEGDDIIQSSNGDDCVVGGLGNDILSNSNGNDIIYGNEGNDRINGSNGNDLMFGGLGNDVINGSNGNDIIYGGKGDDRLKGGNGHDFIYGEDGDDKLSGSNGDDRMFGGEGEDTLFGGNGDDYLEGNQGNDILKGGNANDILIGGSGYDIGDGNLGRDNCKVEVKRNCE